MSQKKTNAANTYAGRVSNSGAQKVDAIFAQAKKKTGKVSSALQEKSKRG